MGLEYKAFIRRDLNHHNCIILARKVRNKHRKPFSLLQKNTCEIKHYNVPEYSLNITVYLTRVVTIHTLFMNETF